MQVSPAIILGLIGQGIAHSLSPQIHAAWGKWCGIPLTYKLFDIAKSGIPQLLFQLRHQQIKGLNVTIPFKQDILAWVDYQAPAVTKTGAANTLFFDEQKGISADNTDYLALKMLLAKLRSEDCVTILGSGGLARSIVAVLQEKAVKQIILICRNPKMGQKKFAGANLRCLAWSEIDQALPYSDLLINATPLGSNNTAVPVLPFGGMKKKAGFFDTVYFPTPTPFQSQAQRAGISATNGRTLLFLQAQASFKLWFRITPPLPTTLSLFE